MSVTPIHPLVASPKAVTVKYDFFNATQTGEKLFSVRAGIPLGDAFDQLTLLLAASQGAMQDVSYAVSADAQPQSQWAAVHMIDFCYALVQSMQQGLIHHENR